MASGEAPGFAGDPTGEAAGEAAGEAKGLAVETGAGVATGLFSGVFVLLHAPNTATLAAKTVDMIIDLLIVFLLSVLTRGRRIARNSDIHSRNDIGRLSANDRRFAPPFAAKYQRCASLNARRGNTCNNFFYLQRSWLT